MVFIKKMATKSLADFVEAITTDHQQRSKAVTGAPVMP
jgi:hypothetical protein